jgi:hypothetical protein
MLVGSLGLFALGAVALWRSRVIGTMRHRARPVAGGVALFIALSAIGSALLAALSLENGTRLDNIVYGRYLEAFAAPVLLLGAVIAGQLSGRVRWEGAWAAIAWSLVAIAATAAGVALYWGYDQSGTVQTTNSFAWEALFHLSGFHLSVVIFAVVGFVVTAVALSLYRLSAVAGTVAVLMAFVPSTAYAYSDVVTQSAGAANEGLLPQTLRAVQSKVPVSCVAWDEANEDSFNFFNSRLYDPDMPFIVFDSDAHQVPCGPLVVGGRNLATKPGFAGYRMVLLGHSPEAVWVAPGAPQTALDSIGWLLPPGYPAPLPPSARQGSLIASAPASELMVRSGTTTTVKLHLTHAGAGAPWPDAASVGPVPQYAVRVAIAWYKAGDQVHPVATGRADLPTSLLPGESTPVEAKLTPIGLDNLALLPGSYDVRLSVIQESVADFGPTIAPVWLHVTVAP